MLRIGVSVILVVLFLGCKTQKEIGEGKLSFPEADLSNTQDVNTPEGIAEATSTIYKDLVEGKTTTADIYPELIEYSAEVSRTQMKGMQNKFDESIRMSQDFFSQQNWHIKNFIFSKAIPGDNSMVGVYRIQVMDTGTLYYFKQDFIQENGAWKIRGDNISDPFKIILNRK